MSQLQINVSVTLRRYDGCVKTPLFFRCFGIWLKCSLTVLLALGPFLHAHYGASHVSGLHMDGMDVAHVMHAHDLSEVTFQNDADEESAAVGVVTSYPRELQLDVSDVEWISIATAWLLFIAGAITSFIPSHLRVSFKRVVRHLYAPGSPPPTLAPPVLMA